MIARYFIACIFVTSTSILRADDAAKMKEAYEDAVRQLQVAQDRKNELANENEQLRQKIATTEEELLRSTNRFSTLRDQTYRLRHEAAALDQFLAADAARWAAWARLFAAPPAQALHETEPRLLVDRDENWPFSAVGL